MIRTITITSPDKPARTLQIRDDGYRIAACWFTYSSELTDAQGGDWHTIMEYKHSGASTDLVYATLAAMMNHIPDAMRLPIADPLRADDDKVYSINVPETPAGILGALRFPAKGITTESGTQFSSEDELPRELEQLIAQLPGTGEKVRHIECYMDDIRNLVRAVRATVLGSVKHCTECSEPLLPGLRCDREACPLRVDQVGPADC